MCRMCPSEIVWIGDLTTCDGRRSGTTFGIIIHIGLADVTIGDYEFVYIHKDTTKPYLVIVSRQTTVIEFIIHFGKERMASMIHLD